MTLSILLPMLLTSAETGITCGVSCGACGTPVVNVFLSSYLLTHSGKLRRSLLSFAGFHLGKMVTVALLCMLISLLGQQVIDENGKLFGVNLQLIVYAAMLMFMAVLIRRWFRDNRKAAEQDPCAGCSGGCCGQSAQASRKKDGFLPMLVYGFISGLSPCTSLVIVLGYAAALTVAEAALVGVCFSLANSIVPLLLLVSLTGLLSKEMYREIPRKIKYFQLATYIIFSAAIVYNMFTSF